MTSLLDSRASRVLKREIGRVLVMHILLLRMLIRGERLLKSRNKISLLMSRENTLRWPTILMVPSDQELMRECRGKTLLMLRDKFMIDEIA